MGQEKLERRLHGGVLPSMWWWSHWLVLEEERRDVKTIQCYSRWQSSSRHLGKSREDIHRCRHLNSVCVCVCLRLCVCTSGVRPGVIFPGHQAMAGTLCPPSHVVPFPHLRGPALPPRISLARDGLCVCVLVCALVLVCVLVNQE